MTNKCICHALCRCECGCGNYDDGSMRWHKLADEKPTEEGYYLVLEKHGGYRASAIVGNKAGIKEGISWWNFNGVTHWLKIQPPESEVSK